MYVKYILDGISDGFRIGFDYANSPLRGHRLVHEISSTESSGGARLPVQGTVGWQGHRTSPPILFLRCIFVVSWKGQLFIDAQLSFGLRSAPIIFSAVADSLEWIAYNHGITFCLHYLDDFLTVGSAASHECSHNMDIPTTTCASLGVPLKLDKVEGRTTSLTFLGIRIDTIAGYLSIPQDKLTAYQARLPRKERSFPS